MEQSGILPPLRERHVAPDPHSVALRQLAHEGRIDKEQMEPLIAQVQQIVGCVQ